MRATTRRRAAPGRHPYPRDVRAREDGPRLAWVDALRVYALLAVFVVHVAAPFDPWDRWHVVNAERSPLLGLVVVLFAPWLMPLVMLLAGVGTWHSLGHRANRAWLGERATRILVPLAVGMLVLVPPQVWLERRLEGRFTGSLPAFYPHLLDGGLYPRGNLAWHHLWFLAHLLAYAVLTLPLFRFLQAPRGRRLLRRLARVCSGHGGLLLLSLPLVVERHLLSPFLTGDRVLFADWSNRGLMLAAYVYGFVLGGERRLGEAIDREWPWAAAGALAGTIALGAVALHGIIPSRLPVPFTPGYLAFWALYAWGAWSWMVALLGAARRWLRRETPFVRWGTRVGAAWYLWHQPIVVAAAFVVVQSRLALPAKVAAVLALSLGTTLVVVESLRRLPWIGVPFGIRARR